MWRVVEAQFLVATRKLVDSDEEQALLDALIDAAKPPVPTSVAAHGLHPLLASPFRYPPLRNGSRFGTRLEPGIFYGALQVETALAEVAYYRFVFLAGTTASLGLLQTEHAAFRVRVDAAWSIDLTRPPFDRFAAALESRTSYAATQALGREMRADGLEAVRFRSARDPEGGTNVALFRPAFASKAPHASTQAWWCTSTDRGVEFKRKVLVGEARVRVFPREVFLVDGVLPSPAV